MPYLDRTTYPSGEARRLERSNPFGSPDSLGVRHIVRTPDHHERIKFNFLVGGPIRDGAEKNREYATFEYTRLDDDTRPS